MAEALLQPDRKGVVGRRNLPHYGGDIAPSGPGLDPAASRRRPHISLRRVLSGRNGIDVADNQRQMHSVGSCIASFQQQARRELTLYAEIPLQHVTPLRILLDEVRPRPARGQGLIQPARKGSHRHRSAGTLHVERRADHRDQRELARQRQVIVLAEGGPYRLFCHLRTGPRQHPRGAKSSAKLDCGNKATQA